MEVDEHEGRSPDRQPVHEMADEPREALREAADEPRRVFYNRPFEGDPADEPGSVPHDPDLVHPVQEEADEPRKRRSF